MERRDHDAGRHVRRWLTRVAEAFEGATLPVDARVAVLAAGRHVPGPAPDRDAFIAATAQVHGLVVATRNVADCAPYGVALVNPWSG